jgi:hypothetical protein
MQNLQHFRSRWVYSCLAVVATGIIFVPAAIARNIGNVTIQQRRIELPRNSEVYLIPVLIESNYTGFKQAMKSGHIFINSRLGTGSKANISSWVSIIPVAPDTKPRDNWKSVVYFRFGCTSEGKVFSADNKSHLYRRVESWIRFDQDPAVPAWAGMDISCGQTADLTGSEAKFLIPLSAIDRLNLDDAERLANGLGSRIMQEASKNPDFVLNTTKGMLENQIMSLEEARDSIISQKLLADKQQKFIDSLNISSEDKARLVDLLKAAQGS